jgi:cytochrome c
MTLTNIITKSIFVSGISFMMSYFPTVDFGVDASLLESSEISTVNGASSIVALPSVVASTSVAASPSVVASPSVAASPAVLVFSKTTGYRHKSIEAGKAAFTKMAAEKKFEVEFTEDAGQFTTANLKRFKAVVFLNTTGDVLDNEQQAVFEKFIQAGGGYLGIHSATDCEYDWPWYGKLAGAYFLSHPGPKNVLNGKYYVVDKNNPATKGMPAEFERSDEFYSFKQIDPSIHVLVKIDEKSYEGGKNGDNHPMSWYHDFDGGRAFYTAMGHTDETFSEPLFLNHVYAGLQYAMGK